MAYRAPSPLLTPVPTSNPASTAFARCALNRGIASVVKREAVGEDLINPVAKCH
jgi:hypothetical protein